jgi:flavin reductase (DIM6/NTAB) family NADH-FMN oxidoreductase RutF
MPRAFDNRFFRGALGRFTTGVIVLSTGPRRAPHAMTANAFMSGSLEPPLVVVSVGKKARMHARLRTAAVRREHPRRGAGARQPPPRGPGPVPGFAPAFGELAGVPVLAQAAVVIAARIKHRYGCGDHTLYVGEVQRLAVNDPAASPLLFYVGRYGSLEPYRDPPGRIAEPFPSFF